MSPGVCRKAGHWIRKVMWLLAAAVLFPGVILSQPEQNQTAALPPIARLQGVNLLSLSGVSQVFFSLDWGVEYRVLRDPVMNTLTIELLGTRMSPSLQPEIKAKEIDGFLSGLRIQQATSSTVQIVFELKGKPGFSYSIESEPPQMLLEFRKGTPISTGVKPKQSPRTPTQSAVKPEPRPVSPTPAAQPAPESASRTTAPAKRVEATPVPAPSEPDRLYEAASIERVRVIEGEHSDRVIIESRGPFSFLRGRLSNPDRLYFDLQTVRLSEGADRRLSVGSPRLIRVRSAQNREGVVRVVLDLAPGVVHRVEMIDGSGQLVITVSFPSK